MYSFHFSLTKVCDYFFSCSWLSVLLMMAYMGTVTVMLLNILVAQMSTTYSQAKKVARLEYDVDRILQLTHGEISFSSKYQSGNATAFFFKYTPTCVFGITSDRVNLLRVRTRVNEEK